jgi:hypothetical protein
MYTRLCNYFITMTCVTLLFCTTASAEDRILSLVTPDTTVPTEIKVQVDNAEYIAGASFTITYNTDNLTLSTIESDFFQTFALQIAPDPECVTVDEVEYCSPIVSDTVASTGTMLAAATVNSGTSGSNTLFNLTFTFNTDAVPGEYTIAIGQSTIDNVSAGYDAAGEEIPLLVGYINGDYPEYDVPVLPSLVIDTADIDNDNDGLDDIWEWYFRPGGVWGTEDALTYYSADDDYDGDGYSDLQEYENWRDGADAPVDYDPAVVNAAGGTGYVSTRIALPAVNLLLLND